METEGNSVLEFQSVISLTFSYTKSQQAVSRCCSLWKKSPVCSGLRRHRGNDQHWITLKMSIILYEPHTNTSTMKFRLVHFYFFFAAIVFGSVLLRPASALTAMRMRPCMERKENALWQRESVPLDLPVDFMAVRPTVNHSAWSLFPRHWA